MNIAWLLFRHSGKANRDRLLLIVAAVGLGMVMVLAFVAGINALMARSTHNNWRLDFYNQKSTATQPIEGVAPLKVALSLDGNLHEYQNKTISVVSMHATGAASPQLKGMPTPKAGEYYVSPGLAKIIKDQPDNPIGSRFGSRQIGIIPDEYVVSPDSLDVVRGMSGDELDDPQVSSIYRFNLTEGVSRYDGFVSMLLFVGAAVLFVPIVIFLMTATQLGGAQREQRYAALRLIGATRQQVARIIIFESSVAALVGIFVGTVVFLAARFPLSEFRFEAMRFWLQDIAVSPLQYVGLVIAVLSLCVAANWWGMRRVQVSPLGVVRKQLRTKRIHPLRIVPLMLGIGVYVWLAIGVNAAWLKANSYQSSLSLLILMGGMLLIMFGLLLAGPYLTQVAARLIARRTKNALTLIATKRIEVQSKAVFRSVSGVVLALFAGSFYLMAVSGMSDYSQRAVSDNGYSRLKPDTALVMGARLPNDIATTLRAQPYVKSVQPIRHAAEGSIIACTDVRDYTTLPCDGKDGKIVVDFEAAATIRPAVGHEVEVAAPLDYLVRLTSNDHIDQLRTVVAMSVPNALLGSGGTYVISGSYAQEAVMTPVIKELSGLAYISIGITLLIATASLTVSTVAGLIERQRSFATLRLGGMLVSQMKRTIMIESLVPLLSTSLLSATIGGWVGYVFISSLSSSLDAVLQPSYFIVTGGGLLIAIVAIWWVLPLLDKLTQPEANQTE